MPSQCLIHKTHSIEIPAPWIIAMLCLITSTGRFVMDSYLPSMPAMAHDVGASGYSIELTLTAYLLGFGVSQLVYGPVSDKYGRKPVLMIGFIVFLIANTWCALAHSFSELIIARLISGVGIGATGVLNRAIASDCFTGSAFSKAWSYTITTIVLVLMIAPLIGGEIQTLFNWRANFILSTIYIAMVTLIIYCKLPETHRNQTKRHGLSQVLKNYHLILSSSSFMKGVLCYTLAFSGLIAYFQTSSLLFMTTLHLSSLSYACTFAAIAFCYMTGGYIVNRCVGIWGTDALLNIGLALMMLSGVWMCLWNQIASIDVSTVLLPTSLYVVGARMVIPNAIANSFTGLRHLGGSTSGMMGFIQMLGSSMISGIVTCFNFASPVWLSVLFIAISLISLIILHSSKTEIIS